MRPARCASKRSPRHREVQMDYGCFSCLGKILSLSRSQDTSSERHPVAIGRFEHHLKFCRMPAAQDGVALAEGTHSDIHQGLLRLRSHRPISAKAYPIVRQIAFEGLSAALPCARAAANLLPIFHFVAPFGLCEHDRLTPVLRVLGIETDRGACHRSGDQDPQAILFQLDFNFAWSLWR
jgi:hypothetical protein